MNTAAEEYANALRMAKRDYHAHILSGTYPYLQVLEEVLQNTEVEREVSLGLVQIPVDQIVGTYSGGRHTAFSAGFLPLLPASSEFGMKWIALCNAHVEEGIRDPIKAYEFMNKFYVVEGNKRVSVLKYFGAVNIPATVTRIIPKKVDSTDHRIYFEFLDFYEATQINYIYFTKENSFHRLQAAVGKEWGEKWTEDEKIAFHGAYYIFDKVFQLRDGGRYPITTGDALLTYIEVYGYEDFLHHTQAVMKTNLAKVWEEVLLKTQDDCREIMLESKEDKKSLLGKLLPSTPVRNIVFVYDKTAMTSGWTYGHELGRLHLEEVFGNQIETSVVDNVFLGDVDETLEKIAASKPDVVFTTSPRLMKASLKAAIEHPGVKFLNCSLNLPNKTIRNYYGRMYEAKYIMGAVAAAMSTKDTIGYIADYPIYGMTANINAFALGARLVNPRAKIWLEWSSEEDNRIEEMKKSSDLDYISGPDMLAPPTQSREFGVFAAREPDPTILALPVLHWGKFYEQLVNSIRNGSFRSDDDRKSLIYWWGMSSGMVDVIASQKLPVGAQRLMELLRYNICNNILNPFAGVLYSQDGKMRQDAEGVLSAQDIITMDWLAENVIGEIPSLREIREDAQPIVRIQGIVDPNEE